MNDREIEACNVMSFAWSMVGNQAASRMAMFRQEYSRANNGVTTWLQDYEWALTDPEWLEAIMLVRLAWGNR